MADLGNFLANMLLGGLSEGQKRRERQAALQDELVKSAGSEYFKQQFDPVAQARRMALSQISTAYPDPQLRLSPQAPPEGAQSLREEFERRKRDVTQQRINAILGLTGHAGLGGMVPIVTVNPFTGQTQDVGNVPRGSKVFSTGQASSTDEIASIVEGVKSGNLPADMSVVSSYRDRSRLSAAFEKEGLNFTKLNTDWVAMKTTAKNMNSTQQIRMRQALESVRQGIPVLRQVSEEFRRSGFRPVGWAQLQAALTGTDSFKRDAATKMVTQINTMRDELAQGFMGGGVPTGQALQLVQDILTPVYGDAQLNAALDQLEVNLNVRLHAIGSTTPLTIGGDISPQYQQFTQPSSAGGLLPAVTPQPVVPQPSTLPVGTRRRGFRVIRQVH